MTTFILLTLGIALIFINFKALKRDKVSFSKTFNATEENMDEYKMELNAIRKEFADTILELQLEIEDLKKINYNKEYEVPYEIHNNNKEDHGIIKEEKSFQDKKEDNNSITEINKDKKISPNNSIKVNEVKKLLNEGCTVEEISEKTGIGKGEVLLITELYLR